MNLRTISLAASLPLFALTPELKAATVSISTAVGGGADVQLTTTATYTSASATYSTPTDQASNSQQANARFNSTTTNLASAIVDIIALRFDLTGYNLATASNVSLNFYSYRDDGSNRSAALVGVTPLATGKDNNGTIAGFDTTNWNEATVKFSTMPGLNWNGSFNNSMSNVTHLDTPNTSTLATSTFTGADLGLGTLHTFSSASLTSFIRDHTGTNFVTLLIRSNNTSSGQLRIGTKESTGLNGATGAVTAGTYAPYLTFTADLAAIPEPSAFSVLAGLFGLGLACTRRRRQN